MATTLDAVLAVGTWSAGAEQRILDRVRHDLSQFSPEICGVN